jgi:ubiquinone/menaquinone biosynthesis C-methylase UbiE
MSSLRKLAITESNNDKEQLYLELRKKEGRFYPDNIIKILPFVNSNHPLYKEWKVRAASFEKLKSYLLKKNKPLHILDLGCGNGWMSNALTTISNSSVVGVDLNIAELEQASRVFGQNEKLQFIYGDIFQDVGEQNFDIIVCAASIQYFPDLSLLIKQLLNLLNSGGEVHFTDSPFYFEKEKLKAKERSRNYFKNLCFEEMSKYYYHHTWEELNEFSHQIIKPSVIQRTLNKITGQASFHWIIIKL